MPTPDPDLASATRHADVRHLLNDLQEKLETEVEDSENEVSHRIVNTAEVALKILREEFMAVVDSTCSRTVKYGTMLALITERMERAA